MTPSTAGARALWLQEHPNVDPACWDMLDAGTRDWWVEKARTVVEAVAAVVWDDAYEKGTDWGEWAAAPVREEPKYTNPYRKDAA